MYLCLHGYLSLRHSFSFRFRANRVTGFSRDESQNSTYLNPAFNATHPSSSVLHYRFRSLWSRLGFSRVAVHL